MSRQITRDITWMFPENGAAVVIPLRLLGVELDDAAGVDEDLLHVAGRRH